MTDHFQKQARFWGISPSYAFVGEPETNGVIERLLQILQEQAIHRRVFQTIDEVGDAVRASPPATTPSGWLRRTATAARLIHVPHGSNSRQVRRMVQPGVQGNRVQLRP
jgi:hypothetical protein